MPGSIDAALNRSRWDSDRRLHELVDWLRIPSVSGDDRLRLDVLRAADFLGARLARMGARVDLVPGATAPVVVGDFGEADADVVVLVYGHYDVQPPGPGWSSPPFRPTPRGGRLYARGTNDDKGQVYAWVSAVGAWRQVGGPRCRVVFVVEGEEEIGSPGLSSVLATLAARLRPTLVVISDTEAGPGGVPALTVSQRGQMSLRIRSEVHGRPVHAGRFGGAVIDPTEALCRLLVVLRGALARLPLPAASPIANGRLRRVPDERIVAAAGARATTGDRLARRIGEGPAMSVVDLRGGSAPSSETGPERRPSAIPTSAEALLDLRLPPRTTVGTVVDRVVKPSLRAVAGSGITIEVIHAAVGHEGLPDQRLLKDLDRAGVLAFGQPMGFVRSGGSLPAVGLVRKYFAVAPALLGLAAPFSGAHGPNEYLNVSKWQQTVEFLILLLGGTLGGQSGRKEHIGITRTGNAAPDRQSASWTIAPMGPDNFPFESPVWQFSGDRRAWTQ